MEYEFAFRPLESQRAVPKFPGLAATGKSTQPVLLYTRGRGVCICLVKFAPISGLLDPLV
jgi:hypothetical protein